jgi:flagellar protein FlbD
VILLTRLNGSEVWLSPLMMESVEETPDTVITLSNGHKYVVRQTAAEIASLVASFYRGIGLAAALTRKEDSE